MKRKGLALSKIFWTQKEDALLKKHYTDLSIDELERLLKRSINSIRYRASVVLKLRRVDSKRLPWTKEEDRILRKLFPSAGWPEIQKALPGRTMPSIFSHARVLALVRIAPGHMPWSEREEKILEDSFGSLSWPELEDSLPGRTRAAITIHAQFRRLKRTHTRKPWSEEEIGLLKVAIQKLKNTDSPEQEDAIISEFKNKVKRSYLAISRKLSELGFS